MDKLQVCVMGMPNMSTSSFKYLSDTLSILAALVMSYVFEIFEMELAGTVWNISLLWFKSNVLL